MAIWNTLTFALAVGLAQVPTQAPEAATALALAKAYGFTDAEMEKVFRGDVLAKALSEGSDKELAGVAAVWLPKSVSEFADITLEGELLKLDPTIRSLHVWRLGESADEAISALRVDAAEQAALQGRQEAYRKNGLKGAGTPGELLALAIKETDLLAHAPGYTQALLDFPAEPLPGMQHRFFAYDQDVEGQRTFVLSHRAAVRSAHHALITEQRYYVSRTYLCRFVVSDCFDVRGGTLVFYVTRLFTDQVAGVGSSLKHAIGRRRMLSDVVAKQKRVRQQLAAGAQGLPLRRGGGAQHPRAIAMHHEVQLHPSRTRRLGGARLRSEKPGRRVPNTASR